LPSYNHVRDQRVKAAPLTAVPSPTISVFHSDLDQARIGEHSLANFRWSKVGEY